MFTEPPRSPTAARQRHRRNARHPTYPPKRRPPAGTQPRAPTSPPLFVAASVTRAGNRTQPTDPGPNPAAKQTELERNPRDLPSHPRPRRRLVSQARNRANAPTSDNPATQMLDRTDAT